MASRNPSLDDAQSSDIGFSPGMQMTEEQFVAWCNEDTRAEWIDGEVVAIPPMSVEHADLIRWLVGATRRCEVYAQRSTEGFQRVEEAGGAIASTVLTGLSLKPQWLWKETRPKVLDVLRQLGVSTD